MKNLSIADAEVFWEFRAQNQSAFLHEVAAHLSITIAKDSSGKPFVVGKPLFVSLSHTDGLVVAAVAPVPVGIDVEKIRPLDYAGVSRRFLKNEITESCDFFRAWTQHECSFKAACANLSFHEIDFGAEYFCTLALERSK